MLGHIVIASVVVLGVFTSVTAPREPPNIPPSGPIVITAGGTYTGHWTSTGSTPPVRVATTEPVTIKNAVITNRHDATLIHAAVPGTNITIYRVFANGGVGRFFAGEEVAGLVVRRSEINRTGGIYILKARPRTTITITRNRQRNVQGAAGLRQFVQLDKVTTATIDISWNEVVNVYGQSRVEDNISIYESAYAAVHDNYIQGAYPDEADEGYAGSGIMIDSHGSHHNAIYSNQIVETTNAGIGIAGGYDNRVYDNRLVFDGRLADGDKLAAANVGLYVWNVARDPNWGNNQAYGNHVGWISARGTRNDWWLPHCTTSCSNRSHKGVIRDVSEREEWIRWARKLLANKVKIGP